MNDNSFALMGSFFGMLNLIFCIASIFIWWRLFVKAGQAGWYILIPFLNLWKISEVVYGAGWKFILWIIPVVNIVALALPYRLCQAYGKTDIATVVMMYIPLVNIYAMFTLESYKGPQTDCFI